MILIKKLLIILSLLEVGNLVGGDTNKTYKNNNSFRIEMLNERGFNMRRSGKVYYVDISHKHQSIFKMKGVTNNKNSTERITWNTKNDYWWSNGIVVDEYWVVNPSSYTKDGVGYSMVGFLPKQENKTVIIYGYYKDMMDSVIVHLR